METDSQKQNIKFDEEKIIDAIKNGDIKMIPHWRFILNTIFKFSGALLILLITIYLISFILFSMQETGVWFSPLFGGIGFYLLIVSMPWVLIVLSIIFVIAFFILVKKNSFIYEKPLVYSFIGLVAIVTICGFLILYTPFHKVFFNMTRSSHILIVENFYKVFGPTRNGEIHRGIILATTTSGFVFQDREGETSTIITKNEFKKLPIIGDDIVILGNEDESGTIVMQNFIEVRN